VNPQYLYDKLGEVANEYARSVVEKANAEKVVAECQKVLADSEAELAGQVDYASLGTNEKSRELAWKAICHNHRPLAAARAALGDAKEHLREAEAALEIMHATRRALEWQARLYQARVMDTAGVEVAYSDRLNDAMTERVMDGAPPPPPPFADDAEMTDAIRGLVGGDS
jgi:hypothetical protein